MKQTQSRQRILALLLALAMCLSLLPGVQHLSTHNPVENGWSEQFLLSLPGEHELLA